VAIGDQAAANRALDYLFQVQQRPDGSFPQNSRVDGKPIGGGLQLDQVALPIVLALQLRRTDAQTWLKHKAGSDFIVTHGPVTNQDRWEEKSGYSPLPSPQRLRVWSVLQRSPEGTGTTRRLCVISRLPMGGRAR
jgi:glucoamylase